MIEKKQVVWDVTVTQTIKLSVCFSEKVTREEAMRLTVKGDYEDIIDESDCTIHEALDAE